MIRAQFTSLRVSQCARAGHLRVHEKRKSCPKHVAIPRDSTAFANKRSTAAPRTARCKPKSPPAKPKKPPSPQRKNIRDEVRTNAGREHSMRPQCLAAHADPSRCSLVGTNRCVLTKWKKSSANAARRTVAIVSDPVTPKLRSPALRSSDASLIAVEWNHHVAILCVNSMTTFRAQPDESQP